MKRLHKNFEKIPIGDVLVNNDYGFFAEYDRIYFYKKGIRITSTLENIAYTLYETDYYLLENDSIAKFIRHESLDGTKRELLYEYKVNPNGEIPGNLNKNILKKYNKIRKECFKKAV